ncbi:hypothetical protein ACH492_27800 [Streptomyces sp. NPDC019443]|uniref:hypothetical protein n=1 Tax=Streptomyces sp. NPDC019443 TaxID=3365061 RepID=UPI00378D2B14
MPVREIHDPRDEGGGVGPVVAGGELGELLAVGPPLVLHPLPSHMLTAVAAARPYVREIATPVADENGPMLTVNQQLR